jgi:hypothetical protein
MEYNTPGNHPGKTAFSGYSQVRGLYDKARKKTSRKKAQKAQK